MTDEDKPKAEKWRYRLDHHYVRHSSPFEKIEFCNSQVLITGGAIRIRRGYSWDGCSPSVRLPGIGAWLGIPEGAWADGKPQSYYASLVHDVLCQYRNRIPITKEQTVILFRDMLIEGGISPIAAKAYAFVVNHFGPQNWLGDLR